MFPQAILDKGLETNSRNYAKLAFLWTVLQPNFCAEFGFWVDDWVLAIESKHFGDFLQIS